jgi:hypothetical protein
MQFSVNTDNEANWSKIICICTFTQTSLIKRPQSACWLECMNLLKDVGNTHIQYHFFSLLSLSIVCLRASFFQGLILQLQQGLGSISYLILNTPYLLFPYLSYFPLKVIHILNFVCLMISNYT